VKLVLRVLREGVLMVTVKAYYFKPDMAIVFAWVPCLGQLERRKVHVFDDV